MRERVLDPEVKTGLTDMEREAAQLLVNGRTRDEVAREMFIGASSVARLLGRIYDKTETENTTAALVECALRGWLEDSGRPRVYSPIASDGPTAAYLLMKIHSCMDADRLAELRVAYKVCQEEAL